MSSDEAPLDADQIRRLIRNEYHLGLPRGSRLMQAAGNDTYAVDIAGTPYVLRVYGPKRWHISGPNDYRFELGLLRHLHAEGVPVSVPMPRRDGDLLGQLTSRGVRRCFSLFSWAPGVPGHTDVLKKPQAYLIGQTLAEIHLAADRYQPEPGHSRYTLDEHTLLDRFVDELEPSLLQDDPSDVAFIRSQVADISRRIRAFDPGPGGWGIVHGDVQPLNHHFTEDGQIIWFDFDLCGYGWRTYDIAYYYTRIPQSVRAPLIEGYESVRPLSRAEHEMLPTIGRLAWIREGLRSKALVKRLHEPYMSYG
ncbi:phosphotransferase [Actinopolymorpha alba]|uniref:phosphotransferase n=1 Tax=Actinopolymorpha alba TaxID=533267 RepID=UPI0003811ABC|nr:phosphotransferase [Actinopolymorpha alba]